MYWKAFLGLGWLEQGLESHLFLIHSVVQMTCYKCCSLILGLIVVALGVLCKIFACGSGDLEKGKKIGQKFGKCEE